jgi:hypothetical protein
VADRDKIREQKFYKSLRSKYNACSVCVCHYSHIGLHLANGNSVHVKQKNSSDTALDDRGFESR